MPSGAGLGILVGITIAICGEWLLALVAGLWSRRPPAVAVAAIVGLATADLAYVSLGSWLGAQIGGFLTDDGLRATIAAGLLVGVAARVAVGLLIGPHGVPGDAVLPTRSMAAWARFAAIGLLWPIPAIITGAVVLARPSIGDGTLGFVLATVAATAVVRWLWAATARNRLRVRSRRSTHVGLGIGAILFLALLAVRPM